MFQIEHKMNTCCPPLSRTIISPVLVLDPRVCSLALFRIKLHVMCDTISVISCNIFAPFLFSSRFLQLKIVFDNIQLDPVSREFKGKSSQEDLVYRFQPMLKNSLLLSGNTIFKHQAYLRCNKKRSNLIYCIASTPWQESGKQQERRNT